ncbi:MAG: Ig-like domain-containing protein [Chitinophagaceae bacterium]|nr:Ig-like domain-containing protein [Chitinophagaceae bacterium]
MKHRNLIPLLLTGFAFLLAVFISGGCAHILPPSGGPRDSLPPVLLRATPADSTLRFSGNQIRFLFNEFVEVDDYNKHLIISPLPENMPTVTRKLETITVRLRDELEENTTYVFNFGRSIKDLNEGNVFRDFTYVISTGNYFDSLEYSGSVVMAHNSEVDTTLFVMLHRNPNDSALTTEKPRYVTRVDTSGNFKFRYLAPGTYYLYALKDESGAYRYFNPESQIFAFADSAVQIGADSTPPARLLAYQVPVTQQASPASSSTATGRRGAKEEKRLKFTLNLKGSQQDLLTPFIMTFEKPLREFDSTKVQFLSDTTYTPIETGYNWTSDSTQTSWTLNYPWKENTLYHLILDKEFATDTLGQQLLKSDTVSFFSKKDKRLRKDSSSFPQPRPG